MICQSPLDVFGIHFAVLGATLGFLLDSFGALRAPNGLSWASLWPPFGSLGTPWGHLGHLGLPSGAWDDLGSKIDVLFCQKLERLQCLRIKSDLAELSHRCEQSMQSGARAAAPNPTSLALGARMTVVKHTPSK